MAETIYVRGEGGGIHAMDLPLPESIQQRLARGQLTRVNKDGSTYTGLVEEAVAAPPTTRPGKTAVKAEWIGWAVSVHHMDPEQAEAMTKTDLMDLADQPSTEPPGGPSDSVVVLPAADAEKSEWIAHVVSKGLLSAEDAANYTKADLIDVAT